MDIISKLESLISEFKARNQKFIEETPELIDKVHSICSDIGHSWSGSFNGYHGSLYYGEYEQPPLNSRFSVEWGTIHGLPDGWKERQPDEVMEEIEKRVSNNFSTDKLEKDSA